MGFGRDISTITLIPQIYGDVRQRMRFPWLLSLDVCSRLITEVYMIQCKLIVPSTLPEEVSVEVDLGS